MRDDRPFSPDEVQPRDSIFLEPTPASADFGATAEEQFQGFVRTQGKICNRVNCHREWQKSNYTPTLTMSSWSKPYVEVTVRRTSI